MSFISFSREPLSFLWLDADVHSVACLEGVKGVPSTDTGYSSSVLLLSRFSETCTWFFPRPSVTVWSHFGMFSALLSL